MLCHKTLEGENGLVELVEIQRAPRGGRKGAEFVNLITFSGERGEGGGSRTVSCVFRGGKHIHIHVANGSLSLS